MKTPVSTLPLGLFFFFVTTYVARAQNSDQKIFQQEAPQLLVTSFNASTTELKSPVCAYADLPRIAQRELLSMNKSVYEPIEIVSGWILENYSDEVESRCEMCGWELEMYNEWKILIEEVMEVARTVD